MFNGSFVDSCGGELPRTDARQLSADLGLGSDDLCRRADNSAHADHRAWGDVPFRHARFDGAKHVVHRNSSVPIRLEPLRFRKDSARVGIEAMADEIDDPSCRPMQNGFSRQANFATVFGILAQIVNEKSVRGILVQTILKVPPVTLRILENCWRQQSERIG